MATCALHKAFFMSTIVVWMFVTMYVLRSGTGNAKTEEFSREAKDSLKVMEELERQNLQLKEMAEKMRVMEMQKFEKVQQDGRQQEELLDEMKQKLEDCKTKNKDLAFQMAEKTKTSVATPVSAESPDPGMRGAYNHIVELWYFVHARLAAIKSEDALPKKVMDEIEYILEDVRTRKSAALIELELTQESIQRKQQQEMKLLQELVQKRLHYLQNPADCKNTRKLVCDLNKGCGFGCQLHHVAYCFMIAFGTQRTLILESKGWRYSPEGWESVFLPVSKTCSKAEGHRVMWNGEKETQDAMIVTLPIVDALQRRPPYMPLSIPEDLAQKLKEMHGNPGVWWLGQLVSYLMRPQPWLSETMSKYIEKIDLSYPIVGIHIRRTDKVGSEAAFHGVAEYMVHAIDWFDKEDLKRQRLGKAKIETRLIYVASDEPKVLGEMRKQYPDYKFLGDVDIAVSAAVSTRYSKSSLVGVLKDIYMLSKCDYLVGTFSSQVSRVAYELMQTFHFDASSYAHSLDDVFYFGGQGAHSQKAVYDHQPRSGANEMQIQVGDILGVAGNHWDGFSKGVNRRTNKVGLYPSFKVIEIVTSVKYPTYPEANNIHFNHSEYT